MSSVALALVGAAMTLAGETSGLVPMGAQSGRPTAADARRVLESAREAGFSEYMVYARSGLGLEYMGEEWMELVGAYLREARRLGMRIWLYDEYNFPSGSCKGEVCAGHPEYANVMAEVYRAADGTFRWAFPHSAPTSANAFDPAAVERFIELTHRRYEQRFGEYFGSVIAGIFSDEPGSEFWRTGENGAPPEGEKALSFRWYPGAEREYREATGRDLRGDVEAFVADRGRDGVWAAYWPLLGRRFRRAFCDPITRWCDRMGIVSTGHLMDESTLPGAIVSNGDILHVLKGLRCPAVDDIFTDVGPRAEFLTYATAQHAAIRGGHGAAAELFALGPSDMTFAKMRQMLWLTALHRIDRWFLALSHVSARGFVEKPHYATFFCDTDPRFGEMRILNAEARRARGFALAPFRIDVGVRYPLRLGARAMMNKSRSEPPLARLASALAWSGVAFDLCEEGEPCEKPVVFAFEEDGRIRDERSGALFPDVPSAVAFVRRALPGLPQLRTADGRPVEGVLVRAYENGSFVALNLTAHGIRGTLFADGRRIADIRLDPRGVWTSADAPMPEAVPLPRGADGWRLALDRPTCRRVRFDADNRATLVLRRPCAVRFAVCRMPGKEREVDLGGRRLLLSEPAAHVPAAYASDFRETAEMTLEAGSHALALSGAADNEPFLPAVWVIGDFAVEDDGTLCGAPTHVRFEPLSKIGHPDFVGKATYSAPVVLPDAEAFSLPVSGAVVRVSAEGRDLGVRAWSPYAWSVPADLRGKSVRLDVEVTTSVRPAFGETWVKGAPCVERPFWVPRETNRDSESW